MSIAPATARTRREWAGMLGGLLSAAEAADALGVSVRQLDGLAEREALIALTDNAGRAVYPGFQFAAGGAPPPVLLDVWRLIAASVVSPWTAASYCATPHPRLGDRSPAECAAAGDASVLLHVVRSDAAAFAA